MDRATCARGVLLLHRLIALVCLITLAACASGAARPAPTASAAPAPGSPGAPTTVVDLPYMAAPVAPLRWRATPVTLSGEADHLCFVAGRPDNILIYDAQEFPRLTRYTWPTGEHGPADHHLVAWTNEGCLSLGEYDHIDSRQTPPHRPTHVSITDHRYIYSLEYDLDLAFAGNRLWVSADMARSWEERAAPAGTYLQALAVAPADSATLFAIAAVVTESGTPAESTTARLRQASYDLYRSTDAGLSWISVSHLYDALVSQYFPILSIEVLPGGDPARLIYSYDRALPGSSNSFTYLLSIDGGRTFREVGIGNIGGRAFLAGTVNAVLRLQTYRADHERLNRSRDGGATWESLSGPPGYLSAPRGFMEPVRLFTVRASPAHVIMADGGGWYSADGGDTWLPIGAVSGEALWVSPFEPLTVFRIIDQRLEVLDLAGM